jgi:predicted kinase
MLITKSPEHTTTKLDLLFIEIVEAAMQSEGKTLEEYNEWEVRLLNAVTKVKDKVILLSDD